MILADALTEAELTFTNGHTLHRFHTSHGQNKDSITNNRNVAEHIKSKPDTLPQMVAYLLTYVLLAWAQTSLYHMITVRTCMHTDELSFTGSPVIEYGSQLLEVGFRG